jgi:hypothetical protein
MIGTACSDSEDATSTTSTSATSATTTALPTTSSLPATTTTAAATVEPTPEEAGSDELPGTAEEICAGLKPLFDPARETESYDADAEFEDFMKDVQAPSDGSSPEWDQMSPAQQQRFTTGARMAAQGEC